jgi:type II secretory pathway component PulJ
MRRAGSERVGRGFTLLETLVSSAWFAVVMVGVYGLYTTMQGSLTRGEITADLQQNARTGMGRLVQELRMAGYDPSDALRLVGPAFPAASPTRKGELRSAGASCLAFVAYAVDHSATPAAPVSRQLSYFLDGTTLRRRDDPWNGATATFTTASGHAGAAQPLAEAVQFLAFAYFDEENGPLTPAPVLTDQPCPPQIGATTQTRTLLTPEQLRQVRRVAITLRTASPAGRAREFYTLSGDVRLRNR